MTNERSAATGAGPRRLLLDPGERVRVLVVDDSVVARRLVSEGLGDTREIEVVGVAASGQIALQKFDQLQPHVVTLDVEMPGLDGLETLRLLRQRNPALVVIMVSSITLTGAKVALEALHLGAADYLAKPQSSSRAESVERLRSDLVPKILQFFSWRSAGAVSGRPVAEAHAPAAAFTARPLAETSGREEGRALASSGWIPAKPPEVLAIGVSTGGPNALPELLSQLPGDYPLPVLIVQHMPPLFTKLLAVRLNSLSPLEVLEAEDGLPIKRGRVILARGDYHLRAERQGRQVVARLDQGPPENSCRPAVDVLFRSVAQVWGGASLAVVLTGMGCDGCAGARLIRSAGGAILVQDEASSVVWGMPGAVAREGLAHRIVPLSGMAAAVTEATLAGRSRWPAAS